MKTIKFKVEWMTCAGCSASINAKLWNTSWVEKVDACHQSKIVEVNFDSSKINKEEILNVVENINFKTSECDDCEIWKNS